MKGIWTCFFLSLHCSAPLWRGTEKYVQKNEQLKISSVKDLWCNVSVCVHLSRLPSRRIGSPLGLHHRYVFSGLLRGCRSRLIAARVSSCCIDCQQGINLTCPTIHQLLPFLKEYLWPGCVFQGFQARTNHVNSHTGQLSSVSVLLAWAGSLGLTFVTLQVRTRVYYTVRGNTTHLYSHDVFS